MSCAVILSLMKFAKVTSRRRTTSVDVTVVLVFFGTIVAKQPHTLTGDIRFHKRFHSMIINNDRDVVVYLPPGYESDKNKRYAVLYLPVGQPRFHGATS